MSFSMSAELRHANVVIAARQFNPTIFSQLWLVRHGIAEEGDFQGESVFTPAFVQVRAPHFVLLVLPEQLQFAPLPPEEKQGSLVLDKIGQIIQLLPETPYVAVGLNFNWHVAIDASHFAAFSRALFFRENPLFNQFNEDGARFGGYLSKDVFDARLKLDVKPVRVETSEGVVDQLLFAFNFHKDVGKEHPETEIQQFLKRWDEAHEASAATVKALEEWKWR
ncbi:MAG: hypothetical protein ACYC35_08865 [Pirellulales bacterium]